MRSLNTTLLLLSLVVCSLVGGGAPAAHGEEFKEQLSALALRSSGQLLQLVPGSYGELFPQGAEAAAETPVLALEIAANEGPPGRLLVPGTGDDAVESQPLLLYDDALDSAVLLWRCAISEGSFRINFATLRAEESGLVWSEIFTVAAEGAAVEFTVEPFLVPTRDMFALELEGGVRLETRQSTIHLFWHSGARLEYTGLSFLEGVYAGWNETLDLSASFLQVPEGQQEGQGTGLPAALASFLTVAPGSDASTLLVTFANAATARFGTLALRAVPLRLSSLGESVRQEIFESADLYDPDDLGPFQEKLGTSIVIIGHRYRLHPAIIEYLADRMDSWILEHGAEYGLEQFTALVEDARDLTVDLTSSVYASTATDPFDLDGTIVEIDLGSLLDGLGNAPSQFIDIEERSNLTPPAVVASPRAFTSASGEDLLVVWSSAEEEGGLDYLESRGGTPWGEQRKLMLSEALEAELAYSLLRKKIR